MNEEEIRAIVREEIKAWFAERQEAEDNAAYFEAERLERRAKREARERADRDDENRRLYDRIRDLELHDIRYQ